MKTIKVIPIRPGAAGPRRARVVPQSSRPKSPPRRLHSAAKHAWVDIMGSRPRLPDPDDTVLERAAVLLAHFRDVGMNRALVALMNSNLTDLGLSPLARARVRDWTGARAAPDQRELRSRRA
jgi:hypothetical protein